MAGLLIWQTSRDRQSRKGFSFFLLEVERSRPRDHPSHAMPTLRVGRGVPGTGPGHFTHHPETDRLHDRRRRHRALRAAAAQRPRLRSARGPLRARSCASPRTVGTPMTKDSRIRRHQARPGYLQPVVLAKGKGAVHRNTPDAPHRFIAIRRCPECDTQNPESRRNARSPPPLAQAGRSVARSA